MNLLGSLMQLGTLLNDETKELFAQFCVKALMSGDPNGFVTRALRRALEPDAPTVVKPAHVEVVEPDPPPRKPTKVIR